MADALAVANGITPESAMPEMDPQTQADTAEQYNADVPVQQAEDVPSADSDVAKAAKEERVRLLPEYLEHFFLEDLLPIDPEDPFNQGIYMRYRINQLRDAQGKEPAE